MYNNITTIEFLFRKSRGHEIISRSGRRNRTFSEPVEQLAADAQLRQYPNRNHSTAMIYAKRQHSRIQQLKKTRANITIDDDSKLLPDSREDNDEYLKQEHWLVHVTTFYFILCKWITKQFSKYICLCFKVRVRFLQLMCEVVVNADDSLIAALENGVLHWQTIIVLLSNQRSTRLRTLTFSLLRNFLLRCHQSNRNSFVSKKGFLLLSGELKKSPVNFAIADALFSMTCGEHVILQNGHVCLICILFDKSYAVADCVRNEEKVWQKVVG